MIASFIYGTSISLPEAVAFVCGFVIIYLLFKMTGVFLLLFALSCSCANSQVLLVENFASTAVTFSSYYTFQEGCSRWPLTSVVVSDFVNNGIHSIDTSHDWLCVIDGVPGNVVNVWSSYPIGYLDSTTGAGMLSSVYSADVDSYQNNEVSQIGDYATGVGSGMSQSESVLAVSNAVSSAISQEEPKTDYSAALMAGMATAFTIAGFGWTYRLAKRVSYSGD